MSTDLIAIADAAAKLPALLQEIYGDLAKPGVRQAGLALETVVGLGNTVLWPIALLNARARLALEGNLERFRERLSNTPEDKIVQVPPEVGAPIAERLAYVTNRELSELYINLLARAASVDTAQFVHPSFVNIVNSLSPDEAMLLGPLRDNGHRPFVTAQFDVPSVGGFAVVLDVGTDLESKAALRFPGNINAYLSNFEGLGLITIRHDQMLKAPKVYSALEARYRPIVESNMPRGVQLRFTHGRLDVTSFGKLFLTACLTPPN